MLGFSTYVYCLWIEFMRKYLNIEYLWAVLPHFVFYIDVIHPIVQARYCVCSQGFTKSDYKNRFVKSALICSMFIFNVPRFIYEPIRFKFGIHVNKKLWICELLISALSGLRIGVPNLAIYFRDSSGFLPLRPPFYDPIWGEHFPICKIGF